MACLPGIGITYSSNLISISFLHTIPDFRFYFLGLADLDNSSKMIWLPNLVECLPLIDLVGQPATGFVTGRFVKPAQQAEPAPALEVEAVASFPVPMWNAESVGNYLKSSCQPVQQQAEITL